MRGLVDICGVDLSWLASRRARCSALALMVVTLTACGRLTWPGSTSTPTPSVVSLLPPPPHIGTSTVEEVFELAGDYIQAAGAGEIVRFTCTIVEGTFCWFGGRPEEDPLPRELSRDIIDQVGAGAVDNASSNQVKIQCNRPRVGGGLSCEIDWGWGAGWRPLPVEP